MYERFTERARDVMKLANRVSQKWNHEYIGTEHILLGLLDEIVESGGGCAIAVLRALSIDLKRLRQEMESRMQSGPEMVTMGRLPQTPRAKKALEYAMQTARDFNHNYVGTEHVLLGLLCDTNGEAAKVLTDVFRLTYERVLDATKLYLQFQNSLQQQNPFVPNAKDVVECMLGSAGIPREELPGVLGVMNTDTPLRRILVAIFRELKVVPEKKPAEPPPEAEAKSPQEVSE